jgi:hypothetical protein
MSGQAQSDKFRRQIGAPGRDDDELLAASGEYFEPALLPLQFDHSVVEPRASPV